MVFQVWNGGVRKDLKKAKRENSKKFWKKTGEAYKDYWKNEKALKKSLRSNIKESFKSPSSENAKEYYKLKNEIKNNKKDFWKKTGTSYKEFLNDQKNSYKKAIKKSKKQERKKILSDPIKLYKHRKEFSEDEIRKAMKTFHMDEELRNLSSNKKKSRLDTPKRLIAYGTTAIAAYGVAKKGKKIVDEILQNRKYKQMSLFD